MAITGLAVITMFREGLQESPILPYDDGKRWQRKKDKPHMKDLMFGKNGDLGIIQLGNDSYYFEIGNEEAEGETPHYHILEDAKFIRFAGYGTKISKGSQAFVKDKAKRDYGGYIMRGGTQKTTIGRDVFIQEYRENTRRNYFGANTNAREQKKRVEHHNKNNRNYYEKVHWQYIERILEQLAPQVADEIGAKLMFSDEGIFDEGMVGAQMSLWEEETQTFTDLNTGEIY